MLIKVKKKKTTLYLLHGVLVGLVFLTACLGQSTEPVETPIVQLEPTPTPKTTGRGAGDTLQILYWQAPNILNPHLSSGLRDWEASRIALEPLASYDQNGNLIPFLAAEIPTLDNGGLAQDGKSVTWKLKGGILWSDGEPFTADDVRFTFEFISNPEVNSTSASIYADVDSVEVIDDHTVRINFNKVNPAWSIPFVGMQGVILPRHVFEDYNGPNAEQAPANLNPVGTGPYRPLAPGMKPQEVLFVGNALIETNKTVYEPNPYFREEDQPYFSRVELRGGATEREAARLVLQSGDIDFARNLQLDIETLAQLEAGGKGKVVSTFGPRVERIYLNHTDPQRVAPSGERSSLEFPHPFFSDERVREAFSYAVDRETIAALYGHTGRPTSNILVSPANFESPNTSYEYNLDKAAALLDEAGWVDTNGDGIRDKDGVRMKVVFQTTINDLRQQTQNIVKAALETLQIEVELEFIDSTTFFSSDPSNPNTAYHFYADLQEYNDGNASPDPGSYMELWTCDQIPQKSNGWTGENVQRWCDPAYEALFEQSATETDPEKRQQLFIQMNDMLIDNFVIIPMVNRAEVFGVSTSIEGIEPTPWDSPFWNMKDWRRSVSP